MTMTDPISDLLTRIRNGQMVKILKSCPASKLKVTYLKFYKMKAILEGMRFLKTKKVNNLKSL